MRQPERQRPLNERAFRPLQDKTLQATIRQRFISEYGYSDALPIAEFITQDLMQLIHQVSQPYARLQPGQMVWLGVHKELPREHHGRRLGDLPLQPIVLSVLTEEETQEIHKITSAGGWFALRCKRTARLFKEADDQGTTLPYADIAALYDQGLWTIKRDVQTWEKQQGQHLPHRGFVHESASPRLIRPKSWKASCKASKFRKPLDCIIIMCTTWNAITRGTMRSKWRWGSPMISI